VPLLSQWNRALGLGMPSRRLNRRSFFSRIAGAGVLAAGSTLLALQPRRASATDRDPSDPASPSTGVTDRDPTDAAGRGRGTGGRPGGGVTDRDPTDAAGRGRGGGTGGRPSGGCSSWNLTTPTHYIQQSNGLGVTLDLSAAPSYSQYDPPNRFVGHAWFYSPTLRHNVSGAVRADLQGNQLTLWITWRDNDYNETGYYRGNIDSSGHVSGVNYPFERPGAQTSWFMREYLQCTAE
jgi:hypothetical protein